MIKIRSKTEKKSSGDEYSTPWPVFEKCDLEFHYDVDVCATARNAKVKQFFSKEENGLYQPWWEYGVCWMNPPYSNVTPWLIKAIHDSRKGALVTALLNCDVSTSWWHELVLGRAEIRYLRGRIRFIEEDGTVSANSPKFGNVLVVYHQKKIYLPVPFDRGLLEQKIPEIVIANKISVDARTPKKPGKLVEKKIKIVGGLNGRK